MIKHSKRDIARAKRGHRLHVLNLINKGDICAEVGVFRGYFSSQILTRDPAKLHLIDPWSWKDVEKFYGIIKTKLATDDRVEIHRDLSTNVQFKKRYFDWVYIDANHSYEEVRKDLNHYYPLIKKGGFLCGDDYCGHKLFRCRRIGLGPKKAVDEFAEEKGVKKIIRGSQFILFVGDSNDN